MTCSNLFTSLPHHIHIHCVFIGKQAIKVANKEGLFTYPETDSDPLPDPKK